MTHYNKNEILQELEAVRSQYMMGDDENNALLIAIRCVRQLSSRQIENIVNLLELEM